MNSFLTAKRSSVLSELIALTPEEKTELENDIKTIGGASEKARTDLANKIKTYPPQKLLKFSYGNNFFNRFCETHPMLIERWEQVLKKNYRLPTIKIAAVSNPELTVSFFARVKTGFLLNQIQERKLTDEELAENNEAQEILNQACNYHFYHAIALRLRIAVIKIKNATESGTELDAQTIKNINDDILAMTTFYRVSGYMSAANVLFDLAYYHFCRKEEPLLAERFNIQAKQFKEMIWREHYNENPPADEKQTAVAALKMAPVHFPKYITLLKIAAEYYYVAALIKDKEKSIELANALHSQGVEGILLALYKTNDWGTVYQRHLKQLEKFVTTDAEFPAPEIFLQMAAEQAAETVKKFFPEANVGTAPHPSMGASS